MASLKEQIWDPVAGFGVTFRTMFRQVVTEEYPFEKKPTAPRFHGRHQLNRWPDGLEKCIGCELCAWACPADAIYVEGADNESEDERHSPGERYGRVYQINYLRCILCGLCIEACPTRALTMTNEYELADDNRADLIYEKSDLLAPLLPGMEEPPHPMRLGETEKDYYLGTRPAPSPAGAGGVVGRVTVLVPRAADGAGGARHGAGAQGRPLRAAAGVRHGRAWRSSTPRWRRRSCSRCRSSSTPAPILMLFLFVLMLVGVDASDSVVETIRGQRLIAAVLGLLFGMVLVLGVAQTAAAASVGLTEANAEGNVPAPRPAAVQPLRPRLRGDQRPADHRGARRDGARPPRAVDAAAHPARPGRAADARLRRQRQATRSAAHARCLRPTQRGRHTGAAARRHADVAVGVAVAAGAGHRARGAGRRGGQDHGRARPAGAGRQGHRSGSGR